MKPSSPTFALIGTGALGGYYGGSLAHAGYNVHFLARSDFEHIKANGLLVESPRGDMKLENVSVFDRIETMPPVDVVLLCLKHTDTKQVTGKLKPLLKPDGVLLVLQNGLNPEAEFVSEVGEANLCGGICFLCSNKLGPGHIKHIDYGNIQFGAYDTAMANDPRLVAVSHAFRKAGIENEIVPNLQTARWRKLVWNVPFNGLSVVLNRSTSQMLADPISKARVKALMEEVILAAAACGHTLEPGLADKMIARTEKMKDYDTSMKLDFTRGRPMELEAIYGQTLKAATKHGLQLPEVEALYESLVKAEASEPNN